MTPIATTATPATIATTTTPLPQTLPFYPPPRVPWLGPWPAVARKRLNIYPWRIHGAGIYANIKGYIDGIHVTIYSSTMDPMGQLHRKNVGKIEHILWLHFSMVLVLVKQHGWAHIKGETLTRPTSNLNYPGIWWMKFVSNWNNGEKQKS